MKQLKVKDILKTLEELKKKYTEEEILEMPIYLGDDDELNSVHCAWFCEDINRQENPSDPVIGMIDGRFGNRLKDKAILIS